MVNQSFYNPISKNLHILFQHTFSKKLELERNIVIIIKNWYNYAIFKKKIHQ